MKTTLLDKAGQGLELTEHGLLIKRLLSLEEWKELMGQVGRVKKLYHCVLSDVTAYGRRNFGDDVVNETLEQLEFDLSDALRAETIALVNHDLRTKYDLNSEQAYVLGHDISDPDERERWAALCQQHDLTAFELKKSIANGRVTRADEITEQSGHTGGIPSVQSVRFHFERWQRQMKDPEQILKLPVPERRKILEVISPIVDFAAKLENSLPKK